jgi:hypothetical protein
LAGLGTLRRAIFARSVTAIPISVAIPAAVATTVTASITITLAAFAALRLAACESAELAAQLFNLPGVCALLLLYFLEQFEDLFHVTQSRLEFLTCVERVLNRLLNGLALRRFGSTAMHNLHRPIVPFRPVLARWPILRGIAPLGRFGALRSVGPVAEFTAVAGLAARWAVWPFRAFRAITAPAALRLVAGRPRGALTAFLFLAFEAGAQGGFPGGDIVHQSSRLGRYRGGGGLFGSGRDRRAVIRRHVGRKVFSGTVTVLAGFGGGVLAAAAAAAPAATSAAATAAVAGTVAWVSGFGF